MRLRVLAALVVVVAVWLSAASAAYANTIWATCSSGGQPQTCDSTGWYPGALTVVWHASPTPDGTSGCGLEVNYHFDSDQVNPVACSATWPGPGSGSTTISQPYTIHVETSSPTATVAPSRPPDSGGWYNHPFAATVSATAFSGIASCSSPTYGGPNTAAATVSATCVDNAGKSVTVTSAPFAYDNTAPSLTAGATTGDGTVDLTWQTGGDIAPIASVDIARSPGPGGAAGDTIYTGTSNKYEDTQVRNGVPYTYTITARDAAGNASTQTMTVIPRPHLTAPVVNASLSGPPMLTWTPVRRATYYNVQVYRNGKKVLSAWPTQPALQLRHTWRYHGHRYRLRPGRYRWYVWPGFGKRRAAHYGREIGSGTFMIAR